MLTRLTVKGFKNLHDIDVEFGPFNCVAGANAAGKSNLFDAIEFLSLLADHPLMEAAQRVRGTGDNRPGDPRDLFWNGYSASPVAPIKLGAELIVPQLVVDDFGQEARASITYLSYELELGYDKQPGPGHIGRLVLLAERLTHINLGDAPGRIRFPHSAKNWRRELLQGRRSGVAFISTEVKDGEVLIKIHQDGGSRGQPRAVAAARSPATVVATTTQSVHPTILAVRREMQSWRRLALVPSSMRTPDSYHEPKSLEQDGRHLAAALYRVAVEGPDEPEDVYARVAGRLASLTGLRVPKLKVEADDRRDTLTLLLQDGDGIELPARSLSEGTLRFLALCVLLEDPSVTGLICMEEPENGIHPLNIAAMVELAQDLAVDPTLFPGRDNPTRQVIINTHSPAVVQQVNKQDLLYADVATTDHSQAGQPQRFLRLRPVRGTWRDRDDSSSVGKLDLLAYLTHPPGAQLALELRDEAA